MSAGLRVYTCLDAILPQPVMRGARTRLWVVAPSSSDAVVMLTERRITWREETFAGPVPTGPFVSAMRRAGLLDEPAVLAYPVPNAPQTPVLRVDLSGRTEPVAVVADVLGYLA